MGEVNSFTVKLQVKSMKALEALAWAKNHCPSYITNCGDDADDDDSDSDDPIYIFYFGSEADVSLFALRWL